MNNKVIKYYAVVKNDKDQIEQILVHHKDGRTQSTQYTDKIYKTMKEACADLERLNCQTA